VEDLPGRRLPRTQRNGARELLAVWRGPVLTLFN
jgi:hypothetical protein